MIKAVIFDMYETLITHYESPIYFGKEIAMDAGMPVENFQKVWMETFSERTVGKISFEEILERIFRDNDCYSEEVMDLVLSKRMAVKEDCFRHLHKEIIPMLEQLKEKGIKIGLISNCFSEEVVAIRNSILYPYFDVPLLSYEEKLQKPDEEIFTRCMDRLGVKPEECIYIGDGGSFELEAATKVGMKAMQAVWYLREGTLQHSKPRDDFRQLKAPLDVMKELGEV